ncbi:type VII secretion integral membrane protein EccD [Corynebacterium halotolerans]|uniref:type VII secretion integral membrane protein EccD n=1 Tax=Corynebacterium halotolerans TaxID=225326 RepID=UPI0006895050|nr:type VII secretion integral membrane protein EccD [Corynebacterium halotolerans]
MAVDQFLRLTVRFHVGSFHREADLALPAGSALADLLPEIWRLCGAPKISRPWQASTAAGTVVDPAVPLHTTSLDHGSVLVLTPHHGVPAPVVRDAAESLADAADRPPAAGLAAAGAVVGCLGLVTVLSALLPASVALAAGAVAALAVLVWRRSARVLAPVAVALAGAAAAAAVLADAPQEAAAYGWAGLAAGVAVLVTLLAAVVVGVVGPRTAAALAAGCTLVGLAAVGMFLPGVSVSAGTLAAPAALVVVAGLVLVTAAPGLSSRAAGLKVPRLPTAGQDLAVSDDPPADVDDRARRALHLHEGLAVGTATVLAPALLLVGAAGGGFPQGLCVAAAGATLLHAARHRHAVPAWAWLEVGLAACLGVCLAALTGGGRPLQLAIGAAVALAGLSSPLWAARVPELEPTAVVWWERAESLAVAATLPLAAHLAGLFSLIRGLG